MKILVSEDDGGSLKVINLLKNSPPDQLTFGAEGKASYIQKMIVVELQNKSKYIIVARRGGFVQMYNAESYELFKEWKPISSQFANPIAGLEFGAGLLYMCTVLGHVIIRDLESDGNEYSYWLSSISELISTFRLHPKQPGIAAYGGKDRELEISWIYPFPLPGQSPERAYEMMERRELVQQMIGPPGPHGMLKRMWHARYVKNNKYGGRIPVWISDVQFLDLDRPIGRGWKVVIGTKYGDIRVYDTSVSNRPIINVQVSCNPITSVCYGLNDDNILYSTSQDVIGRFCVSNGRFNRAKRCIAGTAWVCVSKRGSEVFDEPSEGEGSANADENGNMNDDMSVGTNSNMIMDIDLETNDNEGVDDDEDDDEDDEDEDDDDDDEDDSDSDSDTSDDSSEDEDGGNIVGVNGGENRTGDRNFTLIDSLEPSSVDSSLETPIASSTPYLSDSESLALNGGSSSNINSTTTVSTTTPTHSMNGSNSPFNNKSLPIYATAGIDKTLRVYNLHTNRLIAKVPINSRSSSIWILDSIDPYSNRSTKRLASTSHIGSPNGDYQHQSKRSRI